MECCARGCHERATWRSTTLTDFVFCDEHCEDRFGYVPIDDDEEER